MLFLVKIKTFKPLIPWLSQKMLRNIYFLDQEILSVIYGNAYEDTIFSIRCQYKKYHAEKNVCDLL